MAGLKVIVVGAGIGGMTAANALERVGMTPIVIEQAREFGEVGAGVQLGPNATRVLEGMGHDVGGADGLPGFKTRRSIGRWQEATDRRATCFPDKSIVAALAR